MEIKDDKTMIGDRHRLAFIEFVLSPDVIEHKRQIYGPLDFLGDVGGLADALIGISSFIMSLYFSFFGNPVT